MCFYQLSYRTKMIIKQSSIKVAEGKYITMTTLLTAKHFWYFINGGLSGSGCS